MFGKGDSHENTPVVANQPTKRQKKRREMVKKRQLKRLEEAERKTQKTQKKIYMKMQRKTESKSQD